MPKYILLIIINTDKSFHSTKMFTDVVITLVFGVYCSRTFFFYYLIGGFTSSATLYSLLSFCQSLWVQFCKWIIQQIRYRWPWAGHAAGWPNALLAHLFWTPLQLESPLCSVQATHLKSLSAAYSIHCSLGDVDIQAPKNEVLWNSSINGLTFICVQESLLYCCSPLYFKARGQSLFLGGKVLPRPR